MASFRASLIAEVRNNYAIRTVMAKVNKLLWESMEADRFVTAIYGVLDIHGRRFTYVNAGHNSGLLFRAATGQFDVLDSTGPLLGTLEAAAFKERQTEIRPGDVLVLYTDGITESMNAGQDFFGEDRLKDVIRSRKDAKASHVLRAIREAVGEFSGKEPEDDLTLVVVKGV
jgi:sigma-B regulation protein RsbU (phosphoserine phosphatase)